MTHTVEAENKLDDYEMQPMMKVIHIGKDKELSANVGKA